MNPEVGNGSAIFNEVKLVFNVFYIVVFTNKLDNNATFRRTTTLIIMTLFIEAVDRFSQV